LMDCSKERRALLRGIEPLSYAAKVLAGRMRYDDDN